MLNERILAALIKRAYKSAGYDVSREQDAIWLHAADWHVCCPPDKLPRKVLGLLAEHLGLLPEEGSAWHVGKDTGAQTVMLDTAINLDEEIFDRIESSLGEARPTPLTLRGWHVWQERAKLGVMLLAPDSERIMEHPEKDAACAGGGVCWQEDNISVLVEAQPGFTSELAQLSGYPWSGE